MRKGLFAAIAAILLLLANVSSVFACAWFGYQPKTPRSLQK
ncbi:MAG: cyclic lactone autoinducer peptide [Peptococcaceae bacterium]